MGFEYALVHCKYTIPPAFLLTAVYQPLFTKLDVFKIGFIITIAVAYTIPWDSYLIRNEIWSYPDHVIVGPKLFGIPLEEVFFFVIQTYNTSLLYLILSKPTFQPTYLLAERAPEDSQKPKYLRLRYYKFLGQMVFGGMTVCGWCFVKSAGVSTYTGLILVWAVPILLFLWTLAYQFIIGLPLSNTLIPILLPTLYLWVVDTLALKRGTWAISQGTKFGVHLWDGLEIEEAIFFLVTNTLIVVGHIACDYTLSVLIAFPRLFPQSTYFPTPDVLVRAMLLPSSKYDAGRLTGLREAVMRLRRKSRSFYIASSAFQAQIRADLVLLYSFCRVADDLVDNASSTVEAHAWILKLRQFISMKFNEDVGDEATSDFIHQQFPWEDQSALLQLPINKLSSGPLEDFLRGFEIDLCFNKGGPSPIQTESDLDLYAHRVAGTVAHMCLELIFRNYHSHLDHEGRRKVIEAGDRMGVALQYVNIARDIAVDAKIGRVYIPSTWLDEEKLTFNSIIANPRGQEVERLRKRLLHKAFRLYEGAKGAIEEVPSEARGPLRVAVESYMEIGRVLSQEGYVVKDGRATVPKWRRLKVAWKTLRAR